MKFVPVFVRSGNNYDMDAASNESGLLCPEVSLTKQEFKEECDINEIMRRFGQGEMPPEGLPAPQFVDVTGMQYDFHTAMNVVARAHESFDELPASVRTRFGNDVAAFLDFVADDRNRSEAERLGLVPERVVAKPDVPGAPAEPVKGAEPPAKPVA